MSNKTAKLRTGSYLVDPATLIPFIRLTARSPRVGPPASFSGGAPEGIHNFTRERGASGVRLSIFHFLRIAETVCQRRVNTSRRDGIDQDAIVGSFLGGRFGYGVHACPREAVCYAGCAQILPTSAPTPLCFIYCCLPTGRSQGWPPFMMLMWKIT
jgi:hypothetical protein